MTHTTDTTDTNQASKHTKWTARIVASFTNYEDTFDSEADAQAALDLITQGWDRAMWDEADEVSITGHTALQTKAFIPPEEPYRYLTGEPID